MITALAQAAKAVPAYCSSGYGVLTPAQWKTCWNAGWQMPTTGTANTNVGGTGSVILIVLVIGVALWLLSRLSGSRKTAATSN